MSRGEPITSCGWGAAAATTCPAAACPAASALSAAAPRRSGRANSSLTDGRAC
eukprot:COSAG01_NODE_1233_length_11110_cov_13.006902_16_plen_53_part_00